MKIKGFTILEVIINLALMSIIVSMVYFIFVFLNQTVRDYSSQSNENFQVQTFYLSLREDFFLCEKAVLNNEKITFIFYNASQVNYIQKRNFLFREYESHKDSIPLNDIELGFLHTKDPLSRNKDLIESIKITSILYGEKVFLYAYKQYYSNYTSPNDEY